MIPGLFFVLVLFTTSEAYNETCGEPPTIEHGTVANGKDSSGFYPEGHQILYKCDDSMGYTIVVCEKADMIARWSEPNRPCTVQPNFNRGTAAGLVMAVFNYIIGLTAIWYSSHRHKKKLQKEAIMEAADMMPVL